MSRTDSLKVEDLWKKYPTPAEPLTVLRGVGFSLDAGQTLAIVGPSGSGKSTLLNILGTLERPTSGSARLGDVDLFAMDNEQTSRFRAQRVGFVFQDHHLLPQCTAVENVVMARLARGAVSAADEKRAAELIGQVGLEGRARHLPSELSGGERQRVAVARAMMNEPDVLLCDEPTGNLDSKSSEAIAELLFSLAKATTAILIVVTHNDGLAARFGRQMRMRDGMLTAQDRGG
jgi:lipoprotein-releasing system ATP-binding protein